MKKILYIEDDIDTREAVKIILKNAGFHIDVACSGIDCLKRDNLNYDLFLIDVMLPDMSGWDILQELKKKNLNAKYAFLSAIPITSERLTQLKNANVSDYIQKPFTKDDLVKRVKKIISFKVLYVEDNLDTAQAVKIILNKEGYEIDLAYSGKECLEKNHELFDLILLDIMLPDMSGWDIFESLKNKSLDKKFAFLTSVDADKDRIDELKQYGVSEYIKKPFTKEELLSKINLILK